MKSTIIDYVINIDRTQGELRPMKIALGCVLKTSAGSMIDYLAHLDRVDFQTEDDLPILARSVDSIVQRAHTLGYRHLVVLWEGTIALPSFGRTAEKALKDLEDADALFMAHIIDRASHAKYHGKPETSGYSLFPISMLVNLARWEELGKPTFGDEEKVLSLPIWRSEENIHDNYTPLWLQANDRPETATFGQGWGFIKASIDAGMTALNMPREVRAAQAHIYDNVVAALQKLQRDPFDSSVHVNDKLRDAFHKCRQNWYGRSSLSHYFLHNTESHDLPDGEKRRLIAGIDTFVLPCSSLKWVSVSREAEPRRFVHYDAIPSAIAAAEFVHTHFDGTKQGMHACEAELRTRLQDVYGTTDKLWDRMTGIFDSEAAFSDRFRALKECRHDYVEANILRDPELVIPRCKRLFLSISDIPMWMLNMQAIGSNIIRLKMLHLCDIIDDRVSEYAVIHGKITRHGRFFLTIPEFRSMLAEDRFNESFLASLK